MALLFLHATLEEVKESEVKEVFYMNDKLNPFPCFECNGGCCGPVAINQNEFNQLIKVVQSMSNEERKRLMRQKRPSERCIFYDMEKRNCSVYEARPEVCKMFGHYEMLECPKVPEDNYPIKLKGIKEGMNRIRENDKGAVGVLSMNTFWSDFL